MNCHIFLQIKYIIKQNWTTKNPVDPLLINENSRCVLRSEQIGQEREIEEDKNGGRRRTRDAEQDSKEKG